MQFNWIWLYVSNVSTLQRSFSFNAAKLFNSLDNAPQKNHNQGCFKKLLIFFVKHSNFSTGQRHIFFVQRQQFFYKWQRLLCKFSGYSQCYSKILVWTVRGGCSRETMPRLIWQGGDPWRDYLNSANMFVWAVRLLPYTTNLIVMKRSLTVMKINIGGWVLSVWSLTIPDL